MQNKQAIQNLVAQNKTDQAIKGIKELCKDNINDINILEAKYRQLKNANLLGIISFQEHAQGMAQVNYGLLNILSDCENNPEETREKKSINTKNLRNLILNGLSDDDFKSFCMDNYYDVYNNLAGGQNRTIQANMLIDYVLKNDLVEELLKNLQTANPAMFQKYEPYLE